MFAVPALGGLNFGYDIGATSFTIVQMQEPVLSGTTWWEPVHRSSLVRGIILSPASAGALVGNTLMFAVADLISRKRELQMGSVLYSLGASLQTWSGLTNSLSTQVAITVLIAGRLLYGVGIA